MTMGRAAEMRKVLVQERVGRDRVVRERRFTPVATSDLEVGDEIMLEVRGGVAYNGMNYDGLLVKVTAWKFGAEYEEMLVIIDNTVRRCAPIQIDDYISKRWIALPTDELVYRATKKRAVA